MSRNTWLLLLCGFVVAGCERIPGTKEHAILKGKEAAAALLIDPSSAQFRKTELKDVPEGFFDTPGIRRVVCGEINGKNRNGAYAGFTAFLADPDNADNAQLQPFLLTEPDDFEEARLKCHDRSRASYSDLYERRAACTLVIDQAAEQGEYEAFVENYLALCIAEPGTSTAADTIAVERKKARAQENAAPSENAA